MDRNDDINEKSFQPGEHNQSGGYETEVLNYRRIYPQLVAENKKLWRKIALADRAQVQIANSLYNGRLEIIAVDDEPFMKTLKRLRAYILARRGLGGAAVCVTGELEHVVNPAMKAKDQFVVIVDAVHSLEDENDALTEVAEVGDRLRSDPLALVLWYESADPDNYRPDGRF